MGKKAKRQQGITSDLILFLLNSVNRFRQPTGRMTYRRRNQFIICCSFKRDYSINLKYVTKALTPEFRLESLRTKALESRSSKQDSNYYVFYGTLIARAARKVPEDDSNFK